MNRNTVINDKILMFIPLFLIFIKSLTNINVIGYLALLTSIVFLILIKKKNLVVFLVVLLPWAQILKLNPSDTSFHTILVIFVLLISIVKSSNKIVANNNLLFLIFLAVYIIVINLFNSTFFGTQTIKLFILLFYLQLLVLNKDLLPDKRILISYFILSLFFSFVAGYILQGLPHMSDYFKLAGVHGLEQSTRFSSLNYDPNYNAGQIVFGITIVFYYLLSGNKLKKSIVFLTFFLLIVGFFSLSKMYLFSISLLIIMLLLFNLNFKNKTIAVKIAKKFIILIPFILLYIYFDNTLITAYISRFSTVININTLTTGRSDIALTYLNYFIDEPLKLIVGSGLNLEYLPDNRAAHNLYIQSLFQLGLIGTLILLTFLDRVKKSGWLIFDRNVVIFLPVLVFVFGSLDLLLMHEFVFYLIIFYLIIPSKRYLERGGYVELNNGNNYNIQKK